MCLYSWGWEDRVLGADRQPLTEGLHDLDPVSPGPYEGPQHPASIGRPELSPLPTSPSSVNLFDSVYKEDDDPLMTERAFREETSFLCKD